MLHEFHLRPFFLFGFFGNNGKQQHRIRSIPSLIQTKAAKVFFRRLKFLRPIRADGLEELLGDIHTAGLVGVDAVPCDIAGVHMLK